MTPGPAYLLPRKPAVGLTAILLALVFVAACSRNEPAKAPTLLGVPGHLNQHVSADSDGGALVVLTWAASSESTGTNIVASVSEDGGESFSAPVRVNAIDRQANVNGEQPPRIAVTREGTGTSIVVLWTAKGPDGTLLLSARSTDGGRTFGPTTSLPGVEAPGNRGWESLAAADNGRLYALWLDHRDTAQRAGQGAHQHQHGAGTTSTMDGVARAQRSQLFVSAVDGSLAPKGIARGVCYCCKTALTTGPDGTVYAAWRHVYDGNRRDIAFTMSRDGGRSFGEPVRVSEDNWQIDGCPENGPALSVDVRNRIHVVWPTLVRRSGGEVLQLFHASSVDGRTFTPRARLPTSGAAYHPQIVVTPDGGLVAAWDEVADGARVVKAARAKLEPNQEFVFASLGAGDDLQGGYPALAGTASHAVLAWTRRGEQESRIAVRRLAY